MSCRFFSAGSSVLYAEKIPLVNWEVPDVLGKQLDISRGFGFVAIEPCRVVDTRGGGVFVGAYGPPIMAANATRDFVLGHSDVATGVLGEGLTRGVNGCRETFAGGVGTPVACGVLGLSGTSGVHAFQDVTAGGAKPFVVPYEGDPTKQIVYIATEADEALTSTRGRVKLERGLAVIRVPEHFLKVTEPEGWSVQLTPIGDMGTFAVLRIDPQAGAVFIKGSRSVEVFYRIEGVRRGYADFQPVQENIYFVPESSKAKMDPWPEFTKQVLISNGIYNPDGMPNLETAERLGWKRIWDEKEKAARQIKPLPTDNR